MSDKKIMTFIFSALVATAGYQLFSLHQNEHVSSAAPASSNSVAAVECEDCLSSVSDYCDLESNTCQDDPTCNEWLSCTEDCIALQLDQSCYDDCDATHLGSHSTCSSFKTCACVVCVGQCVDMCVSGDQ